MLTTGDSRSLWADPFVSVSVAAAAHRAPHRAGRVEPGARTRLWSAELSRRARSSSPVGGSGVRVQQWRQRLRNIGVAPASVAAMGEFGRAVKALCAGEQRGVSRARTSRCGGAAIDPGLDGRRGPRSQYLAGQIADGVVLSNALDADVLALARRTSRPGARSVSRSLDDIEIWCTAAMCRRPVEAEGIAGCALPPGRHGRTACTGFHTEGKGLPEEYRDKIAELQRRYDSTAHAAPGRPPGTTDLVEELGLVEFLARQSVIAGPVERRIERIRECAAAGATNLDRQPVRRRPVRLHGRVRRRDRPRVRPKAP